MKRGDIVKLKDAWDYYFRIYADNEGIFYYSTSCEQTAINISKELKEAKQ